MRHALSASNRGRNQIRTVSHGVESTTNQLRIRHYRYIGWITCVREQWYKCNLIRGVHASGIERCPVKQQESKIDYKQCGATYSAVVLANDLPVYERNQTFVHSGLVEVWGLHQFENYSSR
jgi:hypothetical protein